MHTYTYTYIHIQTHTYTYIHIHTHTYIYIHMHTYTYIYIHIHTHTYIYIHVHTYTYIYIHIHTYTYIYIHDSLVDVLGDNISILMKWFHNNYLLMNADTSHLLVTNHLDDIFVNVGREVIKCEKSVKL